MSEELRSRLRWTVTLALLAGLVAGLGALTYRSATQPRVIEIVLPTPASERIARATAQPAPTQPRGPVNVNTASSEELETLTGIGPRIAERIIQWRSDHGPFLRVEDLLQVTGIGPRTLEDLRPFIRVE